MVSQKNTQQEFSILYLWAEKLLQQEYSISFGKEEDIELLFAEGENRRQLYLDVRPGTFLKNLSAICNISGKFRTYDVQLPVLNERERLLFRRWLLKAKLTNVKICRLSPVEALAPTGRFF